MKWISKEEWDASGGYCKACQDMVKTPCETDPLLKAAEILEKKAIEIGAIAGNTDAQNKIHIEGMAAMLHEVAKALRGEEQC